jgi:exodeoxyribonuclease V alpha subunit
MCPTGKAAKRFSDMSGGECKTIHRTLGYAPNSGEVFRQNENNKLDCDMIIIDEASMLDLNILYHLFKAVDLEKIRIVFVGDYRQLFPIRYGSPFKDMCLNFHIPKAQLYNIKRQKIGSGIIEQAHRIQKGQMIEI